MQVWTILYPIVNSSLSKTNFTQTDWSSFYNTEALYTDFTTVLRTATGRAHWPATSGPKGQAVSGLAGDIAGEGGLSVRAHRPAHRAEHRSHWARMGGGRGVVGAVFCCLSNKTTWVAETTAVEVRRNDTKSRSNYAVYPGNSRSNCAVFQGNSRSNCVARQQQIKLLCSKATAELLCSMARTYQTAVFQGNNRSNCCVPRQQQTKLWCSKATTDQTAVFQGNSRQLHGTHLFCREHDQKDLTKEGQKQNTYLLKTMSRNLRSGLIWVYLTRVVVLPLPAQHM